MIFGALLHTPVLYYSPNITTSHITMPSHAELSTFLFLPQGQQTILRSAARINEVLQRCHQQGVEPSRAVLRYIEDELVSVYLYGLLYIILTSYVPQDTALALWGDNQILWPHPVLTEVATVIHGSASQKLADVNLRMITMACVANEYRGMVATIDLERFLEAGDSRPDSPKWWRPDFENNQGVQPCMSILNLYPLF